MHMQQRRKKGIKRKENEDKGGRKTKVSSFKKVVLEPKGTFLLIIVS